MTAGNINNQDAEKTYSITKNTKENDLIDFSVAKPNYSEKTWEVIQLNNQQQGFQNYVHKDNIQTHNQGSHVVNEGQPKISSTRGEDMQIDTYLKEIKDDLRERENRNEKRFSDFESRIEKRDNQFRAETKEREERFNEDAKAREERIEASVEALKTSFQETKSSNKSTMIALWTLSISTILGIAAMIVAVLVAL